MPDNNVNPDLAALQRRVQELRGALDQAVAGVRRRNAVSMVFYLLLIVLAVGYLSFIYSQVAAVDAQMTAALVQAKIQDSLPEVAAGLEQDLKNRAPQAMDALEKHVRQIAPVAKKHLKEATLAQIRQQMPTLENELYGALKTAMTNASQELSKNTAATPEQRMNVLLDNIAQTFGAQTLTFTDTVYGQYAAHANDIIGYLRMLAENKNLDQRQKLQRQAFQYFLAVAERYEKQAKAKIPKAG